VLSSKSTITKIISSIIQFRVCFSGQCFQISRTNAHYCLPNRCADVCSAREHGAIFHSMGADMNNTTGCEQAIILAKNQRVSAKKKIKEPTDGRTGLIAGCRFLTARSIEAAFGSRSPIQRVRTPHTHTCCGITNKYASALSHSHMRE
jgi:hypothetical protein